MEFRNVNLKTEMPPEETSKLMQILDKIPLIIQGVYANNSLASDYNPAVLEVIGDFESSQRAFILQPTKGYLLNWILDTHLAKENGIPSLSGKPGTKDNPRHYITTDNVIDNYLLRIYFSPNQWN